MTDDLGELFAELAPRLSAAGIPFMLVGSVAGMVHGRTRATHDVDLVIEPTEDALLAFVRGLPAEHFYCDEATAMDALRRASQFNILDHHTGWKVDLLIRKPRAFSREEFARRRRVSVFGIDVDVATVEDTILAKLEWSNLAGGSDRQLEDVRELVASTGAALDRDHIERWVDVLGVRDGWNRVR